MRLGVITTYKIGFNSYGIEILNIFPELVIYNYRNDTYKYYGTQYYTMFEGKLWFLEAYQINTVVDERKLICRDVLQRTKSLLTKIMLDKKHEG